MVLVPINSLRTDSILFFSIFACLSFKPQKKILRIGNRFPLEFSHINKNSIFSYLSFGTIVIRLKPLIYSRTKRFLEFL